MRPSNFAKDRRGIAAVEFALIGPVMLFLLIGVFETASLIFAKWSLESAAYDAARFGSTGWGSDSASREARIREILTERSFGTVMLSQITVESSVFPDLPSLIAAETSADGQPGPGGPNDLVLYFVDGVWQPLTPFFDALLGPTPLRVRIPVVNEPF